MKRRILCALLQLPFIGPAAFAAERDSQPSTCWFQCGPYYNPFTRAPTREWETAEYIGGSRLDAERLLPGEYGYRGGDRGRHHLHRDRKP